MTLLGPLGGGKADSIPLAPHVHALVLAAGQGSRFGGSKLHALYQGRPILSYALAAVEAACNRNLFHGGHVVIAANDERAAALVHGTALKPIINDAPDQGLSHSLRLGLEALEGDPQSAAAAVFLADQPRVRLDVIEELIDAWHAGRGPIIRPRYASQPDEPGHPVFLCRQVWPRALQLEGDAGFRVLVDSSVPEAVLIDVAGDNPDVDTLADLEALEESSR